MLKIGITGGIGSGKTTICKIFETLNIPIYYADDRAKWLMTNDNTVKNAVIENFGDNAYLPDGQLDRAYIANIVFQNQAKLSVLNNIVHPAVQEDGENWFSQHKNAPYAIKEAALLVESGGYKHLDKLIVVTAPVALRIERVMQRDRASEADVRARMAKQMPEEEKVKFADFIIENDGEKLLLPQVLAIHRAISLGRK
jgi:dephospho-CoA kinase